jgi:hypothetical protein
MARDLLREIQQLKEEKGELLQQASGRKNGSNGLRAFDKYLHPDDRAMKAVADREAELKRREDALSQMQRSSQEKNVEEPNNSR